MPNLKSKRPDMRDYFRSRVDFHVRGMTSTLRANRPANVATIVGDVTDRDITVTMRDGSVWRWAGGQYSTRKVLGCYAPLMPRPVSGDTDK